MMYSKVAKKAGKAMSNADQAGIKKAGKSLAKHVSKKDAAKMKKKKSNY